MAPSRVALASLPHLMIPVTRAQLASVCVPIEHAKLAGSARARRPIAASRHAPDIVGAFGMGQEPLVGGEDRVSARASEDAEIGLNYSAQRDEHVTAQDLLIAELQHRLRNVLTLVRFWIIHTQSDTLDRYQSALVARMRCLAEAYELIDRCNRDPISLAEVLEQTLRPYAAVFEGRIHATGADVDLEPRLGLALHFVFHELAINACKHGALSSSAGQVEVLSGVDLDETSLVIQWSESGGPEVREPQHRGFGLTLFSKILGDAKVELRFKPTGLTCSILVNIS